MLLRKKKWYDPIQTSIGEKIDLLFKELKEVKVGLNRIEKQLNEDDIDDHRHHINNYNDRKEGCIGAWILMMTMISHARSQ